MLVTFEGTEGAGKSTLIRALESRIRPQLPASTGITITREPGGTTVAERIRELILNQEMDPWCELFLYEAARAEHLAKTIRPALKRGDLVLCDRFTDSSLAYQAHARGLDWKKVELLNGIATQGIQPDLTILIDIDPKVGLERASDQNKFEAEGLAFQKKVRQGFLKACRLNQKRFLVLKTHGRAGARTPDDLADEVIAVILQRRKRRTK